MNQISRYEALTMLVLCLLVAAALRLPNLSTIPPGLHYDEAANVVLGGEIGLQGQHPVFISSYTGKEVLFFYLMGGMIRLLGQTVLAMRLTSALVGLLTIAAVYWLGRELAIDRRVALIAAILLAVSFWHLVFSRLGFRVISQPLLQTLTLAALLHCLRRPSWRWAVTAGLFLGLAAYTYLSVRLFPVLLLLALWPLLRRGTAVSRLRQLLPVGIVALLVATPLLNYFRTHPEAFWVRISQVSPGTDAALSLSESVSRSLQMFFLVGDPYIRFNLPERPLFNPFWGTLLVVGWLFVLWRWSRLEQDWERVAALLLLLNPVIMLLPTALAVNEIVPSNLRALGLIPLIFYLPAIGLQVLLHSIESWLQDRMVSLTTLAIGLIVLLLGGLNTDRLYFQEWATDPALFYAADGDLVAISHYLDAADVENKTIYVAALHYQHPTLAALSPYYQQIKWLVGSQALVFPAEGAALYLFPHSSPLPDWARPLLADHLPRTSSDKTAEAPFTAVSLPTAPTLQPTYDTAVNFGHTLTLLGYDVQVGYTDQTLPLTLYWRVDNPPTADFVPFVHLEDRWQWRWSQIEPLGYAAAQWQPGDTIVQQVAVPIPPGTPPGTYRLRIGFFDPATGERLPQLDGNGRYAGDSFFLENVGILAGDVPDSLPTPTNPLNQPVMPGLRLLGYERGSHTVAAGETLPLALWWQASQPLPPLVTRLEVLRLDNTGRVLTDTQPVHNTYAFEFWYTPQFLIDHVDPQVPLSFSPGEYRLQLRLLDEQNNTRLTAELGPLTITTTSRTFTPPPLPLPLQATFGNQIRLLGYELTAVGANTFTLRLIWQAIRPPDADYTVFVHLLGTDGVCCVWQQDQQPQQNSYPTTRWLADEVVIDEYTLELAEGMGNGRYPLEIGLYLAETGQRLSLTQPHQPATDALTLPPLILETTTP